MANNGTTWIVVCTGPSGITGCEYVDGEQLVRDGSTGSLELVVGGAVVRRFPAGTWSNYTEWVSTDSWFGGFGTPKNSLPAMSSSFPGPRPEALQLGGSLTSSDSSSALSGGLLSPFSGR